jgi:hypothetical protein
MRGFIADPLNVPQLGDKCALPNLVGERDTVPFLMMQPVNCTWGNHILATDAILAARRRKKSAIWFGDSWL